MAGLEVRLEQRLKVGKASVSEVLGEAHQGGGEDAGLCRDAGAGAEGDVAGVLPKEHGDVAQAPGELDGIRREYGAELFVASGTDGTGGSLHLLRNPRKPRLTAVRK